MRKIEGVLLNDIHTYKDLGLQLLGIQIDPADPKLETVSIPMSSNRLNLAKFLNTDVQYEWRNIVLSFDKRDDYYMWAFHSSNIKNLFHGQEVQLILGSDKGFYYTGTALVETSKENNVFCDYLVTLEADPYKYERFSSLEPWVWDVFSFPGGIIRNYKDLEVNGSMTLLIPGRRKKVVPVMDCSVAMTLEYGGRTYHLPAGRSKLLDLQLGEGEHFLTFRGNGKVSVDYRGASL